jgi:hypothetical protein
MQFFGRGFIALANGYVVPNSHLFAQNRILKIRILRLSINFVPHSTWELDKFIGVSIHLVKAFSKVVALLAGIIGCQSRTGSPEFIIFAQDICENLLLTT